MIQAPQAEEIMQHELPDTVRSAFRNSVPSGVFAMAPEELCPAGDAAGLFSEGPTHTMELSGNILHLPESMRIGPTGIVFL